MLEMLCQDYQNLGGVRCQFAMQGDFDHVAQDIGNHLYRIAQESLSNAVKHGQASVIVVQLDESAGQCLMSIQDNGIGLIAADTTRSGIRGIGMKTMRARARMIDSSLEIGGNDEGGVTVSVGWSATHPLHLQSASLDKKLRHH